MAGAKSYVNERLDHLGIVHCFEGIELLHIKVASHTETLVLGIQPLHEQVLALLGPPYQRRYHLAPGAAPRGA